MLISAFTPIRNAQIMGYPVVEAIRSILPIVDEYLVGVGQSDDDTRALIESIGDPRIRILDTHWDLGSTTGGFILADKTNELLDQCRGAWCFYLQADEVVHERDLPIIVERCRALRSDARVEGLLFSYLHFYGSYGVVAHARNWYRNEVRIVRSGVGIRSIGDAQSFSAPGGKPRVERSGAVIHHYGHVKPPTLMGRKHKLMARWWSQRPDPAFDDFRFRQIYGLRRFGGTHPAVMRTLVEAQDWSFEPRLDPRDWRARDYKNVLSDAAEFVLRHRLGERKKYRLMPGR